jgi:hypothetical protein
MYKQFANAVKVPVLANITEFGATPLFTVEELQDGADVGIVLYPLSAFRAMNKAAENVYGAIRRDGTQKNVVDTMQTRMELYDRINYHDFEQKLDALFAAGSPLKNKYRRKDDRTGTTFKPKKSVALSGVTAGNTALCTVGKTGNDLHYRGYDILDVADTCEFEEIAYLLVHGKLPTAAELKGYKAKLRSLRGLPQAVKLALEALPASAHPMDVMRTGVSVLGCVLPEKDDHNTPGARDIADRLMASFGSMLLYWYHYSHNGKRIEVETDDDSIGGHFLHLLHGDEAVRVLGQGDAHVADPVRRA